MPPSKSTNLAINWLSDTKITVKFSIKNVKNIRQYHDISDPLENSFRIRNKNRPKDVLPSGWSITCYLVCIPGDDSVLLKLQVTTDVTSEIDLFFEKALVINKTNTKYGQMSFDEKFHLGFGNKVATLSQQLRNIYLNQEIKIVCHMYTKPIVETTVDNNFPLHGSISKEEKSITDTSFDFIKKLQKLLVINGAFSDITLKFSGNQVKAHKCVLAAQSLVFSKMLIGQESLKEIEINDIDHDVMLLLVNFHVHRRTAYKFRF